MCKRHDWLGLHSWPCLQRSRNKEISVEPRVHLCLGIGWLRMLCFWSSGALTEKWKFGLKRQFADVAPQGEVGLEFIPMDIYGKVWGKRPRASTLYPGTPPCQHLGLFTKRKFLSPVVEGFLWRFHYVDVIDYVTRFVSELSLQPLRPSRRSGAEAESSSPWMVACSFWRPACVLKLSCPPPPRSHSLNIKDTHHSGDWKSSRNSEPGTRDEIFIFYYVTVGNL